MLNVMPLSTTNMNTPFPAPMDFNPSPSPPPAYSIMRIKRKRNEEPLDALRTYLYCSVLSHLFDALSVVVDRGKKKLKSVFQFAETVEQSTWEDE